MEVFFLTIEKKCLVCPLACDLQISINNENNYIVEGNKCNRGRDYALKELIEPSRVITSSVLLQNNPMSRLPVKSNGIIEEKLISQCMEIIKTFQVTAPVEKGQVIIPNILDTNVDIVAARRVNSL